MKKNTYFMIIACAMLFLSAEKMNAQASSHSAKPKNKDATDMVPLTISGNHTAYGQMTASVNEYNHGKCSISISPNPFTSVTRMEFNSKNPNPNYTLQIYDMTGNKVREVTHITNSYYELSKDDLESQVYFYKVLDNEKQVGVGKIIIMK
jgi:hypothetical protein